MNAILALGTTSPSTSERSGRVRRASARLLLALLVMTVQSVAQEPVAAVWQEQELSFFYGSSIAIYSCSALEGRVATILRAVGARDDVSVRASGCSASIMPPNTRINDRGSRNASVPLADSVLNRHTDQKQSAYVRVRVMMPVEVTEDVLTELKKDKARRELVSRVTGNPAARFNDPIPFMAQRQPIILSHKTIGLEPEECELLDQMSASVLRELGVSVVRRGINCDRNRVSQISPELDVEALLASPFGTSDAKQAPATGDEDDADPSAPAASDDESAEPAADKTPE